MIDDGGDDGGDEKVDMLVVADTSAGKPFIIIIIITNIAKSGRVARTLFWKSLIMFE